MAKHQVRVRGIERHGNKFRATVWAGRHEPIRRSFPLDTPPSEIEDWIITTTRLVEQRKLNQTNEAIALNTTFAGYCTKYLRQWGAGKTQHTIDERRTHLTWWAEVFGSRHPHAIQAHEIKAQLDQWRKKYSPATCNKIRQSIFQVFRVLDLGTTHRNPVQDVPTYRVAQPEPLGVDYSTIRQLLDELPETKTKARLTLMAFAGLRPAEIRTIQEGDWTETQLTVRTAKGGRNRTLTLWPEALAALQYLQAHDGLRPFSTEVLSQTLKGACERLSARLGREVKVWPYRFRHSFATALYAASGDQRAVQAALGHCSIATTERYSLGAVDRRLASALAQAQAYIR